MGYVVANWGFTLSHTPGAWHLSRGLLTTRETTLDEVRVGGVSLARPLGLRLAGGARLSAIVTGLAKQPGSAVLVPPAPLAAVRGTAREVLGRAAPVDVPLTGHGPRARTRRWTRALVPALLVAAALVVLVVLGETSAWWLVPAALLPPAGAALAADRVAALGHALADGHLVASSGSLDRRREMLGADSVIGWTMRSTWFQRRAGLTSLVATTAGGRQRVTCSTSPRPTRSRSPAGPPRGCSTPSPSCQVRPGWPPPADRSCGAPATSTVARAAHVVEPAVHTPAARVTKSGSGRRVRASARSRPRAPRSRSTGAPRPLRGRSVAPSDLASAHPGPARRPAAVSPPDRPGTTPPDRTSVCAMFSKVLVANRGEIAIRALRAAYEVGARTVAVFPYEDRWSEHRLKADEAYEIGERGHPVRAYLDPDAIVAVAVRAGADAVYPGYGFLSENPALAEACANAGITFIGPTADVLTLTGNKARAIAAAKAAGVPTLASVEPSTSADELIAAVESAAIPYPLFVKAVAGGGGRGMRRVDDPADLREAVETCMREGEGAFGDPTVFIEQAVVDPRHIEVQILADGQGNVIHLFERDCSVQRRHQKVVELAPAPNLDPAIRERMCADAVRFAEEIGYRNAGTVEFLLDPDGNYVFIEMNPRIQVEHTVTEEVTDVDLVQSQLRIASGETLADLGLSQDDVVLRGAALQCRITTEDPANGFRPDTGKITTYRSPGGSGVRVDGGTVYTGAEVSAHFDSMLAKLTCRGRTFEKAVEKARRAVAEFRIRGVSTNIAFLQALLEDPDFAAGNVTTSFIETHPQLLAARGQGDRGSKLLTYLADVTVNQPHGPAPVSVDPATKLPPTDLGVPAPDGSRQLLLAVGPGGVRPPAAGPADGSRSPTPPSATPTSRCSPRGCAPATCWPSPATSRGPPPSCGRSRPGAARPTTWRCASWPRTRGSGSPRCARPCRTSACRCCCAGATRSATRRTPPR